MLKRNDPHLKIQAPDLKQQLNPHKIPCSVSADKMANKYIYRGWCEVCLIHYIKYKTFCRHLIIVTPKVEVINLHARSPPGCPNQFVTNCWPFAIWGNSENFSSIVHTNDNEADPYLLFWALMMWTVYRILHMHAT